MRRPECQLPDRIIMIIAGFCEYYFLHRTGNWERLIVGDQTNTRAFPAHCLSRQRASNCRRQQVRQNCLTPSHHNKYSHICCCLDVVSGHARELSFEPSLLLAHHSSSVCAGWLAGNTYARAVLNLNSFIALGLAGTLCSPSRC